jgi:DNA gyrase subunit A
MEEISVIGRITQGRTLVRMDPGEQVLDIARADSSDEEDKQFDEDEVEEDSPLSE